MLHQKNKLVLYLVIAVLFTPAVEGMLDLFVETGVYVNWTSTSNSNPCEFCDNEGCMQQADKLFIEDVCYKRTTRDGRARGSRTWSKISETEICEWRYTDQDCQILFPSYQDATGARICRNPKTLEETCGDGDRSNPRKNYHAHDNFCIESDEPTREYVVPMVETRTYSGANITAITTGNEDIFINDLMRDDPTLCVRILSLNGDGEPIPSYVVQYCEGPKSITAMYSDSTCSERDPEVDLLFEASAYEGYEFAILPSGKIFVAPTNVMRNHDCGKPSKIYCKDFSSLGLAEKTESKLKDPKASAQKVDLFQLTSFVNFSSWDNPSPCRAQTCEREGCLGRASLFLEDKCYKRTNSDGTEGRGSTKYTKISDTEICEWRFADLNCLVPRSLVKPGAAAPTKDDIDLYTGLVTYECDKKLKIGSCTNFINDPNGPGAYSDWDVFEDFCVKSNQPFDDYVVPMIEQRTYGDESSCIDGHDKFGDVYFSSNNFDDPNLCTQTAISSNDQGIAGSRLDFCDGSTRVAKQFKDTKCSVLDKEMFESDSCSDQVSSTSNQRLYTSCGETPTYFCKDPFSVENGMILPLSETIGKKDKVGGSKSKKPKKSKGLKGSVKSQKTKTPKRSKNSVRG